MAMSKLYRYTICSLGFGISLEILYKGLLFIKKLYKKQKEAQKLEYFKVLFTNELSKKCFNLHQRNNSLMCDNKFCSLNNRNKIISMINNAQKSIDLCLLIITLEDVSDAILRALKRGIKIRAIFDSTMAANSYSQVNEFSEKGIPICYPSDEGEIMHHKFCIIDGPIVDLENNCTESYLLTGSINWTAQAFLRNYENMIITNNKELIRSFQGEFNRIWTKFNV